MKKKLKLRSVDILRDIHKGVNLFCRIRGSFNFHIYQIRVTFRVCTIQDGVIRFLTLPSALGVFVRFLTSPSDFGLLWFCLMVPCQVFTISFHPLHPNISMHILHTVLYTCPKVLTGRICLTIKRFFG